MFKVKKKEKKRKDIQKKSSTTNNVSVFVCGFSLFFCNRGNSMLLFLNYYWSCVLFCFKFSLYRLFHVSWLKHNWATTHGSPGSLPDPWETAEHGSPGQQVSRDCWGVPHRLATPQQCSWHISSLTVLTCLNLQKPMSHRALPTARGLKTYFSSIKPQEQFWYYIWSSLFPNLKEKNNNFARSAGKVFFNFVLNKNI